MVLDRASPLRESLDTNHVRSSHAVRSQSHRLHAHRRHAHGPLQLAVGAAHAAANSSCGSTTPIASGTTTRRCGRFWLRSAGSDLSWDEGPEIGGPLWTVLPVAARRDLPSGRRSAYSTTRKAYRDFETTEEVQQQARGGRAREAALHQQPAVARAERRRSASNSSPRDGRT